ncbi:DUF342 domain-containing protein [Bacillus sp. FJAT-27986]|uniref:DUF342 domain-containing protein n=1 Tax=Bacillus sp. FJAT-27986 TaxID=1743146 RepID=UPI00080AF8CB|nr:FapA family protein [Bacillus sp. FJAT-27986]OCA89611.1 hypothetical protein A8L44_01325 [Bacillus sp. FJAT-27986]
MDFPYKLEVSQDKMKAWIIPIGNQAQSVSDRQIDEWLVSLPIIFGIKKETKVHLLNTEQVVFPLLIAEGKLPENGQDGELKLEYTKGIDTGEQPFNFRNVMDIPSISTGDKIAAASQPTYGLFGMDIFGNEIKPKPGKRAVYKLGPNVIEHESSLYSTINGQISIVGHTIQVNPVFYVKGDLSLEVGNIDFVGNVYIEGNIPVGYTISCGGDLKVFGMIEGSDINVGGSVFVKGGITGEKNCSIRTGGDLYALYINYANVISSGNIIIQHAILHSFVTSMKSVTCKKGHLIGGVLRAGKRVELMDAGNLHYTRTEIHIGNNDAIKMIKQDLDSRYQKMQKTLSKLSYIAVKLEEKTRLSNDKKDALLLEKQRKTKDFLVDEMKKLKQERLMLDYELQIDEELIINGACYPNLYIKMGKYSMPLNQNYQSVRFTDKGNEISVYPL